MPKAKTSRETDTQHHKLLCRIPSEEAGLLDTLFLLYTWIRQNSPVAGHLISPRKPISWLLPKPVTEMPTLFPPLETREDDGGILPARLKANFETIQAIIRAQHRFGNEERPKSEGSANANAKNVGKKKRKSPSSDVGEGSDDNTENNSHRVVVERRKDDGRLESCKLKLAVETAVAVESEISLLENGIAELEALLLRRGDDIIIDPPTDIEFPALPSVIPDDDPEEKEESNRDDRVREADMTKERLDLCGGGTK